MAKSKILTAKQELLLAAVKTKIDTNIRAANPNNIL